MTTPDHRHLGPRDYDELSDAATSAMEALVAGQRLEPPQKEALVAWHAIARNLRKASWAVLLPRQRAVVLIGDPVSETDAVKVLGFDEYLKEHRDWLLDSVERDFGLRAEAARRGLARGDSGGRRPGPAPGVTWRKAAEELAASATLLAEKRARRGQDDDLTACLRRLGETTRRELDRRAAEGEGT